MVRKGANEASDLRNQRGHVRRVPAGGSMIRGTNGAILWAALLSAVALSASWLRSQEAEPVAKVNAAPTADAASAPAAEPETEAPALPAIDHPPARTPEEAAGMFHVADGLEIGLVAAEPDVAQPLSISFDDRGRMWVLQYRQYPNPNGLTAVEMDEWLRTKYDRLPDPPPEGPTGQDRISIYSDSDGDGRPEEVKQFISDLNLASGLALGHGGAFVVQPPYLLFYADADRDDVPDGPPEVLLKGFGMEDAHAFANSLTWGPDGWLYGCQGSTATADIRGIGFQQGVWRYHPLTREFELFSEGGGNTWGVEFDRYGNLFAAGNTVEPLEHHVQGAYYIKGFGKHGPLHNPHSYGYFLPVLHHGYVGDSLSGGAILYQGGAFPPQFNDGCICPHTRHSAARWSTVETRGSTFATRAAGDFVLSDDIWFRPVDMTVGPDGAVYIADWYDYNISHSSPLNRAEWYQPSRLDGRVWRVAPPNVPPVAAGSFDLSQKSGAELIELLAHPNDWYARQARGIFAERRDPSIVPALTELALGSEDQRLALQGLWSIYVSGGFDEPLAARLLESPHEYVRAWTIRLLGDARSVTPSQRDAFARLAREDESVVVRSQLACTAKRLPAEDMAAIVAPLLARDQDLNDPHVPLLLWWAIEDKAVSNTAAVLRLLESSAAWRQPLVEQIIIERLARRFTAEASDEGYAAAARLLELSPANADTDRIVRGMLAALAGRKLDAVPRPLLPAMDRLTVARGEQPAIVELALRLNAASAAERAMQAANDRALAVEDRVALVKALGETRSAVAVDCLLAMLDAAEPEALHSAALAALGYFDDERIAAVVLGSCTRLAPGPRAAAIELLCSRKQSALKLLEAVDAGAVAPTEVSLTQLRRLSEQDNERIAGLIGKHWGRIQPETPLERQGRMTAIGQMLQRGTGDAASGQVQFKKVCAACHKLHGEGNSVGPDLTGAERKNRELLIRGIVDPSGMIREQYISHVALTADGRVLTGLLAESTDETVTLLDAKNVRTLLRREDLDELQESTVSLMPEKLLDELTEQQIRDLFAYLQSEGQP